MDTDTDDVELTLDLEPEPDPRAPDTAGDPAAEAFARLEGELALMRRAVQHLAAERADIVIPDYGTTLTEMAKRLGNIDVCLDNIAERPAMQLTPDSIGNRIASAAESARRSDHDRISQAQSDLQHATQEMRRLSAHALTAAGQRQQIYRVAGGALLAGILLWSILPGTIARTMPEGWHWPERMARHVLGEPTITEAGIRLIRSQNPKAWEEIAEASSLLDANRAAFRRCRESARRSKGQVQCTLQVRD